MANATQDLPTRQAWFGEYGPRLTQAGYNVVPADGKKMFKDDWLNYKPTSQDFERYRNYNVGTLTKWNPVLDVDVVDPEAVAVIKRVLGALVPCRDAPARIGLWPKFCLVFKCATPFRKRKFVLQKGGVRATVEWLADGQQFISFGTHPDTGKPYEWIGASLDEIPRTKLPEVDAQRADEILAEIERALREVGYTEPAPEAAGTAKGAILLPTPIEHLDEASDAPAWAVQALQRLSPDDRDQWMRVAHYLKAIEQDTGEAWPRDLWTGWSQTSPKYQPGDEDQWDTIERVSIGNPEHAIRSFAGTLDAPTDGFTPDPQAAQAQQDNPLLKRLLDYSFIHTQHIPSAPFIVDHLIPQGVPTLWSAHGGSGKSYVSLQLAVCVAAGIAFFGHPVKKGKVLVYSCEEPEREIHYRLKHILAHYMLTPDDVMGNLKIVNGYGDSDNILFTDGKDIGERLTAKYWSLLDFAKGWKPALVIIDNISEVYDGNEIERAMVRQFIQSMNAICKWCDAGLVLIGHVDAATSVGRTGKGYSGSTAWHNSVRSRLFMHRQEDGTVLLEPSKSNYGQQMPAMVLQFDNMEKVFKLVKTVEQETPMEEDEAALVVLRAIHEMNAKGVVVPRTSSGPGNGVGLIFDHLGMERGRGSRDRRATISDALTRLFNWQAIREEDYEKTDRHTGARLVLTDAGLDMLVREVEEDEGVHFTAHNEVAKGGEGAKGQRAKGVNAAPEGNPWD